MSDFFNDTFGTPPIGTNYRAAYAANREEQGRERNWFERAIAPLDAMQQGLFSFTTNVAEDGFQPRDILDSLSHASQIMNPWSPVTPIDPDEVRRAFFGEQEGASRVQKFGTNLAISLLYDPLLVAPAAKALKLVSEGSRSARVLRAATNPAEEVIRVSMGLAREQLTPRAMNALRRTFGAEKVDTIATRVMQYTVNRYWGVPGELARKVQRVDQDVAKWRQRAFDIFKRTERMAGKQGQDLLAEALETEAYFLMRQGETLTDQGLRSVRALEAKRKRLGINEDLFVQAFDDMRQLDDEIGRGLYRSGLLKREDLAMYQGTHLRRIFRAFERPLDYLDGIVALQKERPDLVNDITTLSANALRRNVRRVSGRATPTGTGMARVGSAERIANSPYLKAGKFDSHRFGQDVWDFMRQNRDVTPDELMGHIKRDMLPGIEMNEGFYAQLMNRITDSEHTIRGAKYYETKIRDLIDGRGTGWRAFQERAEIVAAREKIRPELSEILGEITEAAPRIAAEASDAGRLLEMRRFLDDVAGIRRVDEEAGDLIRQARNVITEGGEVPEALARQIETKVGRRLTPTEIAEWDTGTEIVDASGRRMLGSDLVSAEQNAARGHVYPIPNDPSFGSLAGTWTTPATGMMIRRLEGVSEAFNPTNKIANAALEALRKGTGHFKMFKVIMDPAAQVRNFVGNAVLMELQGTNPFHVRRMIDSGNEVLRFIRTGEMGDYLRLADDVGLSLFQSTFSKNELMAIAEQLTLDTMTNKTWTRGFEQIYAGINRIRRGGTEFAAKAFEFNEMLFKLNVFSDKYDDMAEAWVKAGRLLTDQKKREFAIQAGALAEQALFNYADVPYLVDAVRKYGVVPFATFPFKAVPYVAETLYKHPTRILKYERGVGEFNQSFYGGTPDERAAEIAALPQHVRESLVLKMPFEDVEGRPLYLDLSYFLPWYTIKDLSETFEGGGLEDPGLRSGLLTPPVVALMDAFRRNEDSLGRPIWDPSQSTAEKFAAMGRWLLEFMAPPSAPFIGSRSDSVGRAMQAYARSSPEVEDWVGMIGRGLRANANQDNILTGSGNVGQTQAQVGGGLLGALGFDTGQALLGGATGLLTGGLVASDPQQTRQNAVAKYRGLATDVAREMAAVRSNPSMTPQEKRRRLARLRALLLEARDDRVGTIESLR